MKELEFINIIKNHSELLGDDCAYLKALGVVITQDNFVEDVHFKQDWATPFQIGYKACVVNISDVLASGAKPEYITVGLSVPKNIDSKFIEEFYRGIEAGLYGAKIAGGDITGSDKIFVSITAIGSVRGRNISSRSQAKEGYSVITYGDFGKSSLGLKELYDGKKISENIKVHLEPKLNPKFSEMISTQIDCDYAMMDTSDGLADALFKIAQASHVTIKSEYIEGMFGAEDYNLVACVPKGFLCKIQDYKIIGEVLPYNNTYLQVGDKCYNTYESLNLFDHFE